MSFTEKILQHSNSYKFYKKNYEKLTIKSKTQAKEIKKLKKELKELNQDLEPYIKVESIKIKDNQVNYKFKTSPKLDKFFHKKTMFIEIDEEYKDKLTSIPESILILPLLTNILPVTWLTDSKLIINKIDKTFYEAIPNIKKGYCDMYPDASFKGSIKVKEIEENHYEHEKECISLFSYGVDSLNTAINHIKDKPILVSVYGSDIPINEIEGWNTLKNKINTFAQTNELKNVFIKSDMRKTLNIGELDKAFSKNLYNDDYWHAIQHGLVLIGQGLIYAYLFKVRNLLIASSYSYTKNDLLNKKIIPCASSPYIDNQVKFGSCQVIHDGWEYTRSRKIDNIINFSKETNKKIDMHVCWRTIDGENCNLCEKCARTLIYILSRKENPNNYGFDINDDKLIKIGENFKKVINNENVKGWEMQKPIYKFWKTNQESFKEDYEYWKDSTIAWIFDINFDELSSDTK